MNDLNHQKKEAALSETSSEKKAIPEKKKGKQGLLGDLYDWLEVFAVSIAAVFVLFAFVTRVAVVDGDSMTNTLHHEERLLVQELFYTPKQGDIIVCQSTFFGFDNPLVKRVIATEGQTIAIDRATWTGTEDG
ncbi:MAG: signal peptidase I, partial [Clostridia bacterium]|nr:signal peptidase I [Clostridia bacterium]